MTQNTATLEARLEASFPLFLSLVWKSLDLPPPTRAQIAIANYLQNGPKRLQIQAFRGLGKSWIAAAFVLWTLWIDRDKKILVISASKQRADDFTIFCQKCILEFDWLAHFRPVDDDQRWSRVSFDVAGCRPAQSPSVKSVGITGQITGSRADLIVFDDVEVPANSATDFMREKLLQLVTCGTGGAGMNTLNISTASALLLASMGTKVAKHGNKAVSSKCGSGDVLEALKIKIDLEPNDIEKEINNNNFGFMFAPNYHSAMRFVGPVRKKIGKRTIFNMIGPLSNPALVNRQVVGVFDKKLLKIFAEGLKNLNIKFAWIVNSEDGLDEISPYAKTNVIQLKDGKISEIIIDPKTLNVNAEKFENLIGDDANFNADKMIEIFKGKDNDFSKAVCLNAAAGLIVSEKFTDFSDAYNFAREFILTGKPYSYLEKIQNV